MIAYDAMTEKEKTKPVWVSPRTRQLLFRRAGELQVKTGQKVTLERLIEVALELLDIEAAAKLILEKSKEASPDLRGNEASDNPIKVATA